MRKIGSDHPLEPLAVATIPAIGKLDSVIIVCGRTRKQRSLMDNHSRPKLWNGYSLRWKLSQTVFTTFHSWHHRFVIQCGPRSGHEADEVCLTSCYGINSFVSGGAWLSEERVDYLSRLDKKTRLDRLTLWMAP